MIEWLREFGVSKDLLFERIDNHKISKESGYIWSRISRVVNFILRTSSVIYAPKELGRASIFRKRTWPLNIPFKITIRDTHPRYREFSNHPRLPHLKGMFQRPSSVTKILTLPSSFGPHETGGSENGSIIWADPWSDVRPSLAVAGILIGKKYKWEVIEVSESLHCWEFDLRIGFCWNRDELLAFPRFSLTCVFLIFPWGARLILVALVHRLWYFCNHVNPVAIDSILL